MSYMIERVARAINPRAWAPNQYLFESWRIEDQAKAIRNARAAIEAITQWQPIVTAPKDGTTLLAFGKQGARRADIADRKPVIDMIWFENGEWWAEDRNFDLDEFAPTHWMPLPPPPNTKGEG